MNPWVYKVKNDLNVYDNKPGLVSKGVVIEDFGEWVCNEDGYEYPVWHYSICIYKGNVFRWHEDGRLTKAETHEVKEAMIQLENMIHEASNFTNNIIHVSKQLEKQFWRYGNEFKKYQIPSDFYQSMSFMKAVDLLDDELI